VLRQRVLAGRIDRRHQVLGGRFGVDRAAHTVRRFTPPRFRRERGARRHSRPRSSRRPDGDSLAEVEKNHIAGVLDRTEWNITQAAQVLGIDRVTVYNKIRKYGLQKA
jgi:transcriptional regulator of acetoin/glycerol metabolism